MSDASILVVDADSDDQEFLKDAWNETGFTHPLIFFKSGEEVLGYLKTAPTPFLILSDVRLPKMDGFELKEKLLKDINLKYGSIPFVFWTADASDEQIKRSYDLGGNGFFLKGSTFQEIKQSLIDIVNYWTKSKSPVV